MNTPIFSFSGLTFSGLKSAWLFATCIAMAVTLGGVALMLWAVTGVAHWLLWVVPCAPLVPALLVFMSPLIGPVHSGVAISVQSVERQIEKDLRWIEEIL